MKIFSQLSLLLLCCLLGINGYSQAPKFSVIQNGVTVDNDSIYLQLTNPGYFNYTIKVVNEGPGSYTGPLKLQALYQTKGFTDTLFGDTTVTDVGAGDTITFSHQDQVLQTSTRYKGGGNIVIVWPYSPAITQGDSGRIDVWVDGIIGIDNKVELGNRVSIYPNPTQTTLNFRYGEDLNLLEGVRIINLQGQSLFESSSMVETVDLSQMPRGIYLVTISYTDGMKGTYKLVLQD